MSSRLRPLPKLEEYEYPDIENVSLQAQSFLQSGDQELLGILFVCSGNKVRILPSVKGDQKEIDPEEVFLLE